MSDTNIGLQRLEQLADHLEKGQLGHERFDFTTYNSAHSSYCGTAGCAVGECPIIFHDLWHWDAIGEPVIDGEYSAIRSAMSFFSLPHIEANHLFVPEGQTTQVYGGKHLSDNATRYDVAANIREFIDIKATPHPVNQ